MGGKFRLAVSLPSRGCMITFCPCDSPTGLSIRPHDMPKFLRIGVHQSNVSGYTSKAWCIRRAGSQIFLKWGAVEVLGAGEGRKVYWTRFQEKTIRCRTV